MTAQELLILSDIVGITGVILTLLAYLLLQINRLSSDGITYSLMNLVGSVFIVFSLFYNWNTPALIMEFMWMLISVWGITKVFRR